MGGVANQPDAVKIVAKLMDMGVKFQITERGDVEYELVADATNMSQADMATIQSLMQLLRENRDEAYSHIRHMAKILEDAFRDVRPDLGEKYGDGHLWKAMLRKAAEADPDLWYNLRAFRILTTVFRTSAKTGNPRLAPVIGKDWHELVPGWRSQKEYDDLKETYLAPYRDHLQRIIKEVIAEHELS